MSTATLILNSNADATLFDWFHEQVLEATRTLPSPLSTDTALYLTQLLVDRARTDRDAPTADTLAELHAAGAHGSPSEQVRAYRELGDRALYVVGYFHESFSAPRKLVSPTYYCSMGSAAYHRCDTAFKTWFANAFGEVFAELAVRFPAAVTVLGKVRAATNDAPDPLMRDYDEWLATGDEAVAKRLRAHGLVLPTTAGDG